MVRSLQSIEPEVGVCLGPRVVAELSPLCADSVEKVGGRRPCGPQGRRPRNEIPAKINNWNDFATKRPLTGWPRKFNSDKLADECPRGLFQHNPPQADLPTSPPGCVVQTGRPAFRAPSRLDLPGLNRGSVESLRDAEVMYRLLLERRL